MTPRLQHLPAKIDVHEELLKFCSKLHQVAGNH